MSTNKNNRDQEEIILRYLNDELNAREMSELESKLQDDSAFRELFNEYRSVWFHSDTGNNVKQDVVERAFNRFQTNIQLKSPTRRLLNLNPFIRVTLKIAAAIFFGILLITSFLYGYQKINEAKTPVSITEAIVPMGSISKMVLSDGTQITLNAGSKIKFNSGFGKKNRDIFLSGEAFFKVKRFEKLPFIVHAENMEIKALGTEFNVTAYPDENKVEALLIEGKISVQAIIKDERSSVILEPNQRIIYQKDGENLVLEKNKKHKPNELNSSSSQSGKKQRITEIEKSFNPEALVSWKEDNWLINNEKLKDLAIKLERKYDVKIIFTEEALMNFRFSGTLRNETLEQVLEVIKLTSPVLYEVNGKSVTFSEDQEKKKRYETIYNLNN